MSILSFKCPNCGGPVTFDAAKQLFDCEYCGGEFDEATLTAYAQQEEQKRAADAAADAEAEESGETVIYNCPSCGAEIVTDNTTAATYCYFCHNPVVLTGRLANEYRPDRVLPFAIDREQAISKFLAWTKGKKFVPKDFFAKKQIESISGVYYPYWMADYQGQAHFEGEGTTTSTSRFGDHQVTTTKYYQVIRDAEVEYRNLARPALTKADRKLSDGVHPFDMSQARNFSTSFLSGFMAEKRDVEASAVRPEIEQEVRGYVEADIRDKSGYNSLTGRTETNFHHVQYHYCLLPTWVLTYKGKDGQTYHYAMNGQNGRLCGVLPIDKGKVWGNAALWFGIVTALLCLGGWLFI